MTQRPVIAKEAIAKLIALVQNTSVEIVLPTLTDEQAQNYALNIGNILTPGEIFDPIDMAAFVAADNGVFNEDEALVFAATKDPEEVFVGGEGTAKLDEWAIANDYARS
jgi:hypothetical protein